MDTDGPAFVDPAEVYKLISSEVDGQHPWDDVADEKAFNAWLSSPRFVSKHGVCGGFSMPDVRLPNTQDDIRKVFDILRAVIAR